MPSVIYGLLAIFTLVPLMRDYVEPFLKDTLGLPALFHGPDLRRRLSHGRRGSGGHDFPFIISVSREALLAVPREQREAALALGATKWESTWQVVVPYARLGIIGSIFLALARALGETMAVTMVIGNDPAIHASLFAPGYTIAAVIANEFTEATGDLYLSALVELGLVLFLLTIVINGSGAAADHRYHAERDRQASMNSRTARRNIVNNVMLTPDRRLRPADRRPCCSSSWAIWSTTAASRSNWNFFTKLPLSAGRDRRRHGQRDRGQRQDCAAGCADRHSHRLPGAASTWPSSAARRFRFWSATPRTC